MFESEASDNPYPVSELRVTIRPRGIIRYLGGSIGVLASLPILFLIGTLISQPNVFFESFDVYALIPLAVHLAAAWATYRWFTIGGRIQKDEVVLRGWFRTLKFSLSNFYEIRKQYYSKYSEKLGEHQAWRYEAFDKDNRSIGAVPAAMQFCKDWEAFMEQTNSLAR